VSPRKLPHHFPLQNLHFIAIIAKYRNQMDKDPASAPQPGQIDYLCRLEKARKKER